MNREFEPRTLDPPTPKSLGDLRPPRPGQSHENLPSLEYVPTKTEVESLEETLASALSSQTPSLLPLVDRIALAATHDVPLLLTGETGLREPAGDRLDSRVWPTWGSGEKPSVRPQARAVGQLQEPAPHLRSAHRAARRAMSRHRRG
jgi:hypothetical protein